MKKPVILCVDDEKDVLDSLFDLILNEFKDDYDIELAETGEEAIEIFNDCKTENIDIPLVIVDYLMPRMKGDELLIKLHKKRPRMMKILLTGQATLDGVRNSYEHAGLYRYIDKPWEKHDLILTISEALKSYHSDRTLEELLYEKIALIEKIKLAEQKYKGLFENAVEGIFQTSFNGNITTMNPAMARILGYDSLDEALHMIKSLKNDVICNPAHWDKFISGLTTKKNTIELETLLCKKDKSKIWVLMEARSVFINNNEQIEGFIIDITEKKKTKEALVKYQKNLEELVKERTEEVRKKTGKIMESITYASRIQKAILPKDNIFENILNDYFVLWRPLNKVGGDFYWFHKSHDNYFIGIMDCTGHGVPGALMSMMGYSVLNHVTTHICNDNPAGILKEVNRLIKNLLNQDQKDSLTNDGMDAAICYIKPGEKKIIFAGAGLRLYYTQGHKCFEINGDQQSIGYAYSDSEFEFTNHELKLTGDEVVYLTTDGFYEQAGGTKGFGLGRKRLKKILSQHSDKRLKEQKELLIQELAIYRGNFPQRDDITIIGFLI